MKKLTLDEIKGIELEILNYFDKFCSENHLQYYLDGGTLLGAVRHKGFIPWDDDIDVLMPRYDYEKLVKLSVKIDDRFILKSYKLDSDYSYPYMKIVMAGTSIIEKNISYHGYGVFIDIFPMDCLPNDEYKRQKFQNKIWALTNMANYAVEDKIERHGLISNIKKKVSRLVGIQTILKLIDKEAVKYESDDALYAYDVIASTKKDRLVRKNVFDETVKLPFEGKMYNAPSKYDEYLTELYGDYMQLPPLDKQYSDHNFEAYIEEMGDCDE